MSQVSRSLQIFCLFFAVSLVTHADAAAPQKPEIDASACIAKQVKKHCKKKSNKKVFNLAVTLEGSGSGRVSSRPSGIYCQTDCSEDFAKNTRVLLEARPYSGSLFTGWSGACSGVDPCRIKLKADTTVSANFIPIEMPPLSLVTPYVNEAHMREIRDYFNAQYDSLPWGRIHDGLDLYPNDNLRPYQSACSGRVKKIYVFDNQVTLLIDCDASYSIDYNFEAQAPDTGHIQLGHILVTEGQLVEQGEVIGYLYSAANPDHAHVHFTLYQDAAPVCPAPFFTQGAHESILNLVAVVHTDVVMCRSGNVLPPPLATPYFDASDFTRISAGFSNAYSFSPWDYPHDGLDIYPAADLKPVQAACSGKVDALTMEQSTESGHWLVKLAIVCDDYVEDPDIGGYFIPWTTKYVFQTMSSDPAVGQQQFDNIMVALEDSLTEGEIIGYLKAVNAHAHLHFELQQFGQSAFQVYGITGIPICPQAQFSASARNSVLTLLQASWPGAEMCYQE